MFAMILDVEKARVVDVIDVRKGRAARIDGASISSLVVVSAE